MGSFLPSREPVMRSIIDVMTSLSWFPLLFWGPHTEFLGSPPGTVLGSTSAWKTEFIPKDATCVSSTQAYAQSLSSCSISGDHLYQLHYWHCTPYFCQMEDTGSRPSVGFPLWPQGLYFPLFSSQGACLVFSIQLYPHCCCCQTYLLLAMSSGCYC